MSPRASDARRSAARRPRAAHGLAAATADRPRIAEVVLDVEVERGLVHLVLTNCGDAVATDVSVTFSHPLIGLGGTLEVSSLALFQRLGVLRPGRDLRVFWDTAPSLLAKKDQVAPFVASVSWTAPAGTRHRAEYHHDLSIYRVWPACHETAVGDD